MSERSRMKAGDVRGASLIALSLGLGALSALFAPASLSLSVWKEYRSLLVEASVPETEVLAALAAGGYDSVISPRTEPVYLSDWVRLEATTLTAALERLVPGDPRGDPYLRALPSWFEASVAGIRYSAYFIPVPRNPFAANDLGRSLAGFRGRYVIADSEYAESGTRDSIAAVLSLAIMFSAIVVIPTSIGRAD
ncbi:MAG: hypothetical protein Q8M76_07135, partial [Spirochaetaceae bacterium]|nr:hypothetical protein [Spirochaetaceae bacterium]